MALNEIFISIISLKLDVFFVCQSWKIKTIHLLGTMVYLDVFRDRNIEIENGLKCKLYIVLIIQRINEPQKIYWGQQHSLDSHCL